MALNTLIAMIENTGFVVKPYFFYPELLTIIRNLVQSEQVSSVRKLVFKLIGTLGAVDPYLINQIILYHKNKNNNEESEMLQNLPMMLGIEPHMIKSQQFDLGDGADGGNGQGSSSAVGLLQPQQHARHAQAYRGKGSTFDFLSGLLVGGREGPGFLALGQPPNQGGQREVPIVLDINRPLNDEYVAGMGGGLN